MDKRPDCSQGPALLADVDAVIARLRGLVARSRPAAGVDRSPAAMALRTALSMRRGLAAQLAEAERTAKARPRLWLVVDPDAAGGGG